MIPLALAALQEGDCAMCHAVPEVAAPPRTDNCVTCHQWVKSVAANPAAREKAMAYFPKWERYERNVATYFAVPDLGVAFSRLEPEWIRAYLRDPYDVRPTMPETMVRVGLDDAEIGAIVSWASSLRRTPAVSPAPRAENVAIGEKLYRERGCFACHAFGETGTGIPAAPDLRHARDRMSDDMIVEWILRPSPGSAMPAMVQDTHEAVALRDYLVLAEPGGKRAPAPVTVIATNAPVRWDDVESRVFGKICVHCHMDPAQNEGRAGPGNAGGFGWEATGIELQTYESVRDRRDTILAAIERRRHEAARDYLSPGEFPVALARPALPGMPLGLPPISDEDIAMVKAWYAQGAPR